MRSLLRRNFNFQNDGGSLQFSRKNVSSVFYPLRSVKSTSKETNFPTIKIEALLFKMRSSELPYDLFLQSYISLNDSQFLITITIIGTIVLRCTY